MPFTPTHIAPNTRLFRHSIVPYELTPKPQDWKGDEIARVDWAFTVREGKWDVTAELGSIDADSRARWLKPVDDPEWCEHGGGAHQFTVALLNAQGRLMKAQPGGISGKTFLFWSRGVEKIGLTPIELDAELRDHGYVTQTGLRGWATSELYSSSAYDYEAGASGSWSAMPLAPADIYTGVGMPGSNEHISTVVVWRMTPRIAEPGDLPVDPESVKTILTHLAGINASLAKLATQFERFNNQVFPEK